MRRRLLSKGITSAAVEESHGHSGLNNKDHQWRRGKINTTNLAVGTVLLLFFYFTLLPSVKLIESNESPSFIRQRQVEAVHSEDTRNVTSKPTVALPNVLLIEAGTSAVSNWLFDAGACHPQIFDGEPSFFTKQVQFFDQDERYKQGIDFYSQRFKHCLLEPDGASDIILDATPNYLEFPQRVFDIYDAGNAKENLKLIFVLREQVETTLVTYRLKANDYNKASDKKNGWFADAVNSDGSLMNFEQYSLAFRNRIEGKAAFHRWLKTWAQCFHRNQMLVVSYDELRDDPSKVQWRIEQFIGRELKPELAAHDEIKTEDIPKRAIQVLEPLFRESNDELYDFLSTNQGPVMEQKPFSTFVQRTIPKEPDGLLLPNVLIIGAQKSGTSAVAEWMFANGVCNPKKFEGEPFFYNKEVQFFDNDERYAQGIEFYASRYSHCSDQGLDELIMDATPHTILHPRRVYDLYNQPAAGGMMSKLKLILILRDPIERELSSYNHKVFDFKEAEAMEKRGWVDGTWYQDVVKSDGSVKSFTEYCEFVKKAIVKKTLNYTISRYVEHLKAWTSLFSRSQLLVLSYDELRSDPSTVQWRIEQFLESKFHGALAESNGSTSASKLSLKEIPESAIRMLQPLFRDLNQELYDFLSKNPGPPMEQSPFPHFVEYQLS